MFLEDASSYVNATTILLAGKEGIVSCKGIRTVRVSDIYVLGAKSEKLPPLSRIKPGGRSTIGIRAKNKMAKRFEQKVKVLKEVNYVSNDFSFTREGLGLRGTPDAFIIQNTRGKKSKKFLRPVEIKSSPNYRSKRNFNHMLTKSKFPIERIENKLHPKHPPKFRLKENTPWWRQLQLYMLITDSDYGYLGLLVGNYPHLILVSKNNIYRESIMNKLNQLKDNNLGTATTDMTLTSKTPWT